MIHVCALVKHLHAQQIVLKPLRKGKNLNLVENHQGAARVIFVPRAPLLHAKTQDNVRVHLVAIHIHPVL
jgi:hypothetical protein